MVELFNINLNWESTISNSNLIKYNISNDNHRITIDVDTVKALLKFQEVNYKMRLAIMEVNILKEEMNMLLTRVEDIDKKYDSKIDNIHSHLQDFKGSIARLEGKVDSVQSNINDIKDVLLAIPNIQEKLTVIDTTVKHVKDNIEAEKANNKWWKQYFLAPIITGIIVGLVFLFVK